MKILLISTTKESNLFMLNLISNSLKNILRNKNLSLDLIFVGKNNLDDNILFLRSEFNTICCDKQNKFSCIKKNYYDFLFSIENSLRGFYLSRFLNVKKKFFLNKYNKFFQKKNRTSLQFVDEIRNILKDNFSYNKILIPNFYFDNEQIQKDQQMIYWIFKMNHFTEIDKEKYIILELINYGYYNKRHVKLIAKICNFLIKNFRVKVFFLSNSNLFYNKVKKSVTKNFQNKLILNFQNNINIIPFYPFFKHSTLVITNKKNQTDFLQLFKKPVYLFSLKKQLFNSLFKFPFCRKNVFKKNLMRIEGELHYILKKLN